MLSADVSSDQFRTMTIEAFADTIVPGEKRGDADPAIAGVAEGGGAVAAGAVELVRTPATGLAGGIGNLSDALNKHAEAYAAERRLTLDAAVPPFVALAFGDRSALLTALTAPGHPERDLWVLLALFSFMAFDTAAHIHTTDAIAASHPGLTAMGFAEPDADGLWRFAEYSYGLPLADLHPDTTPSGSPA
jgi:enediyne biosynthesis protein E8